MASPPPTTPPPLSQDVLLVGKVTGKNGVHFNASLGCVENPSGWNHQIRWTCDMFGRNFPTGSEVRVGIIDQVVLIFRLYDLMLY